MHGAKPPVRYMKSTTKDIQDANVFALHLQVIIIIDFTDSNCSAIHGGASALFHVLASGKADRTGQLELSMQMEL